MYSIKNINKDKYEQYLNTLDEKKKSYVIKIIDNLNFFTTLEVIEMVRRSVRKITSQYKNYNIYIPKCKIGSEHFLMLSLKDELHPINIINDETKPDNDYPILIIDDAIYSSCNMCGHIDNLIYQTGCKNKILIAVAVISSYKCEVLEDKYFNATAIADLNCEHLLPKNLFDNYDPEYMYKEFKCETPNILPIYFEHKLANTFGAYQFIKNIIDKPISRKVIDDIRQEDIDSFIEISLNKSITT